MTHLTNTPDRLSDYLPDQRRSAIGDMLARNLFLRSSLLTTHTTLAANDTVTTQASESLRIREVQVGAVSGGTVTLQVYVDGVPVFQNSLRPVSGGAVRQPHLRDRWVIPGRSIVKTIIEATSGAPTGSANVVITTEPFVMVPQTPEIALKGRGRLRVSLQRFVDAFNDASPVVDLAVQARYVGGIIGRDKQHISPIEVTVSGSLSGGNIPTPDGGPDDTKPPPIIKPPKPGGGGGGTLPPIKPPTF